MDHAQLTAAMDVQTLRVLVAEQLQVIAERDRLIAQQVAVITRPEPTITRHERTITEREARISVLTAEIARLRRAQFAARSEKMDPAQRALFEEAMAADIAAVEAELEALQAPAADERTEDRPRQAPKRRPLPEDPERIETRHEPASCRCNQFGGDLVRIGEHISEKLSCKGSTAGGRQQRHRRRDRLHPAPLAGAGAIRRRRRLSDRQQPDRERDPADRPGAKKLAVYRFQNRRPTRCGDHEPAGDGQGQRP